MSRNETRKPERMDYARNGHHKQERDQPIEKWPLHKGLHGKPELHLHGEKSSGTSKEAIDMCGRKINTWSGRFSQVFQKSILAKSLPLGRIEEDPKREQNENTGVRFLD